MLSGVIIRKFEGDPSPEYEVKSDGYIYCATILHEDEKVLGLPDIGDEVMIVRLDLKKRSKDLYIVGRSKKLGPNAYFKG